MGNSGGVFILCKYDFAELARQRQELGWWWDSTIFTATIPANYIVQNKVEYYVRTGNNVFVHFDTEETVGRALDEKVSTRIYWEAGPPPSGGAGQGS